MKSQEFGALLRAYANVVGSSGGRNREARLIEFASVFEVKPSDTVKVFLGRIEKISSSFFTGNPSLGDVANMLDGLKEIVQHTAKPPVVADLLATLNFLRGNAAAGLSAFVDGANSPIVIKKKKAAPKVPVDKAGLVAGYLAQLTTSLRDTAQFKIVYDNLCADKAMGKPETIALAKQFSEASASTKKDALKKVLNRHQSLVEFEARQKATAGRTAA